MDDDDLPKSPGKMITDDQAAIWEEYRIEAAIHAALYRWNETKVLQADGDAKEKQFLSTRTTAAALHKRFADEYSVAKKRYEEHKSPVALAVLEDAAGRCEIVSTNHAPIDRELHAEYEALAPAIDGIEHAIHALLVDEEHLRQSGKQVPWYRRRSGPSGYFSKRRRRWVVSGDGPEEVTRGRRLWSERAGADPVVALTITREILRSVKPEAPSGGRGKYRFRQVDEILRLCKTAVPPVDDQTIMKLLDELGFPKVSLKNRLTDLRKNGLIPPPDTKKGRPRKEVAEERDRRHAAAKGAHAR